MDSLETEALLRDLTRARAAFEAEDLEQWYYDDPYLMGRDMQDQFDVVRRGMTGLVQHIAGNPDPWGTVFGLSEGAWRVLEHWRDIPYQPGTYRTDFVLSGDGSIKLVEVTCRFALNAFFGSSLPYAIAERWLAAQTTPPAIHDVYDRFYTHFAKRMRGRSRMLVLTGDDRRNESRYLHRIFDGSPIEVISIDHREMDKARPLIASSMVISEMSLEELASLGDDDLARLAEAGMLNDPRTMYLVHDKAFMAAIADTKAQRAALGADDAARFARHVLPACIHGHAPEMWEDARANRQNWIMKHRRMGKGQSIFAGPITPDADWQALFERSDLGDFMLQRWEPQAQFHGILNGASRADYIAGSQLLMDGQDFGLVEFRTCENPVSNTGAFRKIASLHLADSDHSMWHGTWKGRI